MFDKTPLIIHYPSRYLLLRLVFFFFVFWLSACQANLKLPFYRPTPTPTATPTPTITPTPTLSPTPTPTPTPAPTTQLDRGEHALRNGDWDLAQQEFQTVLNNSPEAEAQAFAWLGLGRTYLASGQYDKAIQAFQTLIQNHPNSTQLAYAYYFLAKTQESIRQPAQAAEAYKNYRALHAGAADAYILDFEGDAWFTAGNYLEAIKAYLAAVQAPSVLDEINLQMKLARAYALDGQADVALQLYNQLYNQTLNEHTKALIDLRKGQVYLDEGQSELAYAAFLDAVTYYPTAYESFSALESLVAAKVPVDDLNRGIVDYYAEEYAGSLRALDRYLKTNPADPTTAHYYTGLAYRARGTYKAAIAEFDLVIQADTTHPLWDKAWEEKATTQGLYLEQFPSAIQTLLDFVRLYPLHSHAGEFLYDAAQYAEQDGQLKQAAELWERVPVEYPAYEQAQRALFLAGLSEYRLGEYIQALSAFKRLLDMGKTLNDRSVAMFWVGKTQSAQGDVQGAQATWEKTANVDPTGYYSERARDLLRKLASFTPPLVFDLVIDWPTERKHAEDWLRSTFDLPADTNLQGLGTLADDSNLKRGTELWSLGLFDEARSEFEYLRQAVQNDPLQSYLLANYLANLGLYRSAALTARQVLNLAGMDDAATLNAPRLFNYLRFGAYYSEIILPQAQKYKFHPLIIFSVIRQESMFESFVSSSAAASGLMQVIPSTGAEIAQRLDWPPNYTTSDLYRPMINVVFGTYYLDRQRQSFDGDLFTALAAYNGGPGNAAVWKALAPDDPDLFLEIIPFEETRTYIRSIYEIFTIYRQLYDRTP